MWSDEDVAIRDPSRKKTMLETELWKCERKMNSRSKEKAIQHTSCPRMGVPIVQQVMASAMLNASWKELKAMYLLSGENATVKDALYTKSTSEREGLHH